MNNNASKNESIEGDVPVVNKSLNNKIFDGEKVKPDIRKHLLEIAGAFTKFLKVEVDVEEVILAGSLANYNYTVHSDLDLHILFDYSALDDNRELVEEFFAAKRGLWNEVHDIHVAGFVVEVYPQNVNEKLISGGIYSLTNDDWVKKPDPNQNPKVDYATVEKKATGLMNDIDYAITTKASPEFWEKLRDRIRAMRKAGLEKGGEYSVENMSFKVLRNRGYLKKIADARIGSVDRELSYESVQRRVDFLLEGADNLTLPPPLKDSLHCPFVVIDGALQVGESGAAHGAAANNSYNGKAAQLDVPLVPS